MNAREINPASEEEKTSVGGQERRPASRGIIIN
jgi:hypothetical protein